MRFLSTPSARRATTLIIGLLPKRLISIHALREEGDSAMTRLCLTTMNFYPRPPRGGRLGVHAVALFSPIFLSTPSARRATLEWR